MHSITYTCVKFTNTTLQLDVCQHLSNHLEPPLTSQSQKSNGHDNRCDTLPSPVCTPEAKRQWLNEVEVNSKFISFYVHFLLMQASKYGVSCVLSIIPRLHSCRPHKHHLKISKQKLSPHSRWNWSHSKSSTTNLQLLPAEAKYQISQPSSQFSAPSLPQHHLQSHPRLHHLQCDLPGYYSRTCWQPWDNIQGTDVTGRKVPVHPRAVRAEQLRKVFTSFVIHRCYMAFLESFHGVFSYYYYL